MIVAVVVIAIVAIVSFTLLNSFGGIIFAQHTVSIETGSVTVAAQTYQSIQFTVPDGASNIMVQGIFTASGGSGNDIKVYIMSSTNFTNWQNGHQVNAIYNSGQVTTESINIQLPSSGSYYVVFDNSFSPFSSKTVFAQLNLVYTK